MKGIQSAFCGKLYRDAEVRTSAKTGRAWMILRIAVGEEDGPFEFVNVAAFRDSFIDLAPHLTQGAALYVEGTMKLRRWETGEGQAAELSCAASLIQPMGLIGQKRPKAPRAVKGKKAAKVDSQAPIEFNDALPF
jgi:single-stranded DNA-binding protein